MRPTPCGCTSARWEPSNSPQISVKTVQSGGSMRRPQASFEAQPRAAQLLAPKIGIDPYKRYAFLHWCVRFFGCVLPGGQGRPPLRLD